MKALDYNLYDRVKAQFPPQPLTLILVSLAPENLEKLEAQSFKADELDALWLLTIPHHKSATPFALIGGFEPGEAAFEFYGHEFECEEDLNTGKLVRFSFETHQNRPVNAENAKRDLKKLESGVVLIGNA